MVFIARFAFHRPPRRRAVAWAANDASARTARHGGRGNSRISENFYNPIPRPALPIPASAIASRSCAPSGRAAQG
jgi:hypothetical protein